MVAKFYTLLLETLFPRHCFQCQVLGHHLCPACLTLIPAAETPDHEDDYAVFPYHHPAIKQAIWTLKYRGGSSLGRELGELLFHYYIDSLAEREQLHLSEQPLLVIPIPLARARRRERGYNQAELLAEYFTNCDKNNFDLVTDSLFKIRDTASQVSVKNADRRRQNVAKSLAVAHPEKIKKRTVLVIDDVLTTGGTIAEARRVLKKAGARKVYGLALAHG